MSFMRLLRASLRFYRWTHLAVIVGVVVGTAVIAGALIVGDSVRESLRTMTLERLGPVDWTLTGPRFFTVDLADRFAKSHGDEDPLPIPAILLPATAERRKGGQPQVLARAGRVNVIALNPDGWKKLLPDTPVPAEGELLANERLAHDLQAAVGEEIALAIELPSDIPRDALLGKRDDSSVQAVFKLRETLPAQAPGGRFGLQPDQQIPANAYVLLDDLQQQLRLDGKETPRRNRQRQTPQKQSARVNSLLLSFSGDHSKSASAGGLNQRLQQEWRLEDLHARIVINEKHGYISFESTRMILDRPLADAARDVAQEMHAEISPVLAYIANEISLDKNDANAENTDQSPAYSRYSVVAGLEPKWISPSASPPFGPFVFAAPEHPADLKSGAIEQADGVGEIILNEWLATDLKAQVGDRVRLAYLVVGSHGELPEIERQFVVKGIVRLDETAAADRGLIPEVRGITDVDSFDEWDAPFPMTKKVTPRDDEYWKKYRATPKAFVTLDAAQHLWSSRYGDLTSLRIGPIPGQTLEETRKKFEAALLKRLDPTQLGLVFQPVKQRGLAAASGTTDFSGLFIGFSFFLILSAMILIGLLFRLGIERRASNVGLLLAVGLPPRLVSRQFLSEAGIVVAVGVVIGLIAARSYAALIIYGLKTWWIDAIGTRFLELHTTATSLMTGAAIAAIAGVVSIWLAIRRLWSIPPRQLLAGVTQPAQNPKHLAARRRIPRAHFLAVGSIVLTSLVIFKLVPDREAFAGFSWPTIIFFVVGMNTLAAGLAYLGLWVESGRLASVHGHGVLAAGRFGIRNAARNRARSMLSTGLIASAAFLIVAIAAGHRNPAVEHPVKASGNGGFTLVAESSVPLLYDLNTPDGRSKLDLDDPQSVQTFSSLSQAVSFRVNPGENASCLNIYQTVQPTILGVPPEMTARGGFKFIGASQENPWHLLQETDADGAIPVFGDMNTLQYSLHVGPGATLKIRAENGEMVNVRIAGMFDGSVFQGVLLMDEKPFQKLYPSRVGYQYFLLELPPEHATEVSELLESKLPGFDAERVADRLASFLAVQNTYLSTFQALGGLGLLLGTIGLGAVMLRNVLERRSELALLRATGFRDSLLAALVLFESGLLLSWGLAIGAASALLAMLPHLLSTGADLPWNQVGLILLVVFVVGMLASLFAVRSSWRTPVLATLRAE